MPTFVKVVNHGPYALELRGQKPGSQPTPDAEGRPRDYPMHVIQLEKGAHTVDAEALETILEHNASALGLFEAQCTLEEADPAGGNAPHVPNARVTDLSKLALAGALQAVQECKDPAQLEQWLLQDARSMVKKAMHLKHRELCPPDEELSA